MRWIITDDVGFVKLGGVLLPGIFEGCEIRGNVKLDEIDVPGQSGKSTQPMGFEDAVIVLKLRLNNEGGSSPYEKARTIVGLFRRMDKNAKPYVYRIVNKLASIWGIKEVIFKELVTYDANADDTLRAELTLREYKPVIVKKEAMAPKPKKEDKKPEGSARKGYVESFARTEEQDKAARQKIKEAIKSPAVDDDKPR